jgi:hypothetical protein
MTSMALDVINTVSRNIRETGSYELIVTTGECIRKMGVGDENLVEYDLYLLQMRNKEQVASYYRLNVIDKPSEPKL